MMLRVFLSIGNGPEIRYSQANEKNVEPLGNCSWCNIYWIWM